ncbi:MAG: hypothetical protein R3C49_06850 [Planctomycetaceae bacterium]
MLISNTAADRLIDWSKRFNTYVVPINTTIAGGTVASPSVIRDPLKPVVVDFLISLVAAAGGDTNIDPANNAIHAEIGLVTVEDGALWQAQLWQKKDRDPAPTNLFQGLDTYGLTVSIGRHPGSRIRPADRRGRRRNVGHSHADAVDRAHVERHDSCRLVEHSSRHGRHEPRHVHSDELVCPAVCHTDVAPDDTINHGDHDIPVRFSVDSAADSAYRGLILPPVMVTCIDNDAATVPVLNVPAKTADEPGNHMERRRCAAVSYEVWVTSLAVKSGPVIHETVSGTSLILQKAWASKHTGSGFERFFQRKSFCVEHRSSHADQPARPADFANRCGTRRHSHANARHGHPSTELFDMNCGSTT